MKPGCNALDTGHGGQAHTKELPEYPGWFTPEIAQIVSKKGSRRNEVATILGTSKRVRNLCVSRQLLWPVRPG